MRSTEATEHGPAAAGAEDGPTGEGAEAARADGGVRPPSRAVSAGPTDRHGRQRSAPSGGTRALALIVRIVLGVAILGVAAAIAGVLVMNTRQALQAPVEEIVRRVRIVEAVPRAAAEVARRWEGYGTARAMNQAEVASEVTARVVSRPARIDPGVSVSVGETLVKLEESDFRERLEASQRAADALEAQLEGLDVERARLADQVEQAAEQVRLTEWELERLEQARAGAAATELEVMRLRVTVSRLEGERLRLQQSLDSVPSRRASLQAELAARQNDAAVAKRQLERTTVTSPINGVIQTITANVGETIQAGQTIARVVDLGRIEVPLRVPASAHGGIRVGNAATVRAGGNGASPAEWEARVARISPEADPATRTITVYLEVEQATPPAPSGGAGWEGLLLPGRFVSAQVGAAAGNGERLILVPRRAVIDDRVWVAVQDEAGATRAQPRQVRVLYYVDARLPELDPDETQWAVIGSGIEAGARVIVTNLDDLLPGVRVEVVEGGG